MQGEVRAGEQRVDVGADRVERDVAEVEQAGESDHDVQAERQHHVQDGEVGDAHPGGSRVGKRKRQEKQRCNNQKNTNPDPRRRFHARSPTRSPSSPEGRNTSTRISTRNEITSW